MTTNDLFIADFCPHLWRNVTHSEKSQWRGEMQVLSFNGNVKKAHKKKRNSKMSELIAKIYESNDFTIEAAHKALLAKGDL